MPRLSRFTALELAGVAAATGAGWGIVMALIAWHREGAEVVLLQGWILGAAWGFGRAARDRRAGALAGFALVAAAVWCYELLPFWGVEAAARREGLRPAEVAAVAAAMDADDVALLSTLLIGALVGWGAALRPAPAAPEPAPEAPPAAPPPEPPAPLWASLEPPQPPPAPETPDEMPAPRFSRPPAPAAPWAGAFLFAALATDAGLDRVFGFYTAPQAGLALAFLVAAAVAVAAVARRYALLMAVAGAVLALAFGAVQHWEYQSRTHPEIAVIR